MLPMLALAQTDSTAKASVDTLAKVVADTTAVPVVEPVFFIGNIDTTVANTPMNCYKEYVDYFSERGAKPVTDGMQLVVIALKKKESCHCYMGRVEVAGGKIKAPIYVQTESGDYKTSAELGKKLDPDFLAAIGDGLWDISNGMSTVFQTTYQEYGRFFFYKFVNKNAKQMQKMAPSPSDLLKD
jgi:hypothetical protein